MRGRLCAPVKKTEKCMLSHDSPAGHEEDVGSKLQQVQWTSVTMPSRFLGTSYLSDWIFLRTVAPLLSHSHLFPSESALKRGALIYTRALTHTHRRAYTRLEC